MYQIDADQIHEVMARILQIFAGPQYKEELQTAKKDFFSHTAVLDPNNSNYQLRLNQFYDWYFFTRSLIGHGQTPLQSCHFARELRFADKDQAIIEVMKAHRHSLFEFIKFKDQDFIIKDVITEEKIIIKDFPLQFGFEQEEFFEARLMKYEKNYYFAKGFCFHPVNAKKFILEEVKTLKANPDLEFSELALRLLKMRYRMEQYRHVSPEKIYTR